MPREPEQHRRRRSSCNELLARPLNDSQSDIEPAEPEGLLGRDPSDQDGAPSPAEPAARRRQAFFIRTLALLCACSLSIGSHYASNILGPLKSRLARELGTSNTEFSLLISAYSLNSTWTPLVGGLLASTLGTTVTSILATGVILLGQVLLLAGDMWGNVRLMAFGLFVFGLGVSPVAVVQETIIVRFFKSHGLGVSMALGLVAGKGASFVSARTSYPLTERFGPRAPFYVATFLAGLSVVVNLIYIAASNWLVDGAGAELEAPDITEEARRRSVACNLSEAQALEKVAAKRRVNLRQITKLGDVFWSYVGLNLLCGMIWSPFTHLAANIIERRYSLSEQDAATQASYLLAGSLVLYPICGFLVDRFRHRPIVVQLLLLSSGLTLYAYAWLALPQSWTQSPMPAIAAFGAGHGFAPLLLVVLVPRIVPLKYVSTALGAHKSLEQTGSTIFQTLAGLALDIRKHTDQTATKTAIQHLLNIFLLLNALQFLTILTLAYLQQRRFPAKHRLLLPLDASSAQHAAEEQRPLLEPSDSHAHSRYSSAGPGESPLCARRARGEARTKSEVRRGEVFATLSVALVVSAWVLFMGTAWFRLGMKHGKNLT